MYRYLLFRNYEQIFSSNDYFNVLSWMTSGRQRCPDAYYEIIDQCYKPGFVQCLH